jgi:Ca2+-binding EF-hand superfamily protein
MIEAVNRSKVQNLSNLFELIDKRNLGTIDRQDFSDIFLALDLKID